MRQNRAHTRGRKRRDNRDGMNITFVQLRPTDVAREQGARSATVVGQRGLTQQGVPGRCRDRGRNLNRCLPWRRLYRIAKRCSRELRESMTRSPETCPCAVVQCATRLLPVARLLNGHLSSIRRLDIQVGPLPTDSMEF